MTKIITENPADLVALKAQGLSLDLLEQRLIPDAQKDLFIVSGQTGHRKLGTYKTWLVRAFRNQMISEQYAEACSKHAQEWMLVRDSYKQSPPFGWSLLDPRMSMSYDGTSYVIQRVPIALRPEDIISSEEICPICGTFIEETPFGKVCENGHEL